MDAAYITIAKDGAHELDIKKSRFICHLKRTETVEEAQAFIQKIKKSHAKANHNCSAFTIGKNGTQQRANDDGEPTGTAGIPMLEVLNKNQLQNVTAVVTRYFGGIKLGTSGLIRAYSHTVAETIKRIGLVQALTQTEVVVTIPYTYFDKLKYTFDKENFYINDIQYTEQVILTCFIDKERLENFKQILIDCSQNQYDLQVGKDRFHETPILFS